MVGRRKYDDGCAIAQALDVIGERWASLVVRELVLGPKRFTDLLAGLHGASSDMLTQRLRDLSEAGVVRRRRLGPPVSLGFTSSPSGAPNWRRSSSGWHTGFTSRRTCATTCRWGRTR